MSMVRVYDLCCEYKHNLLGTDERRPRLGWKLDGGESRHIRQSAYRLQVAKDDHFDRPLWDTGVTDSSQSVHIVYEGPDLESRTRYYYRVQVWTADGAQSDWSETAYWETALLSQGEWRAFFITAAMANSQGNQEDKAGQAAAATASEATDEDEPCDYLRKSFALKPGLAVQSARIYATALGMYRLYVDGAPVDDTLLAPGWTSYRKRLQYQTYDATRLLQSTKTGDEHVLGVIIGNGWYKGNLAWEGLRDIFGDTRALLLQMHIVYADGSEETVTSDETWECGTGALRMSELYHGEVYDARLADPGWNQPGYDAAVAKMNWSSAKRYAHSLDTLVAQENDPVRIVDELTPIAVLTTPKGETVYDIGQNMVGWVRFTVRAARGAVIKLTHAEVLDHAGNFYTDNLRSARQTITYICQGADAESYEPYLSFQGFRYVRVEGLPTDGAIEKLTGCVLHTDMLPTGSFSCSDELVNQLQHNIVWGQKGNFVDIPTDCPQRDERLGWTGDAQAFVRTAAFNYQIAPFFRKWLRDLAADQLPDGSVPHVVPDIPGVGYNSAAWADAAVICPWTIYEVYGDKRVLEQQFASMTAWVDYVRAQGDNEFLWNTGFHFGDWLGLDAKEGSGTGSTPRDLIATAFYAYSTELVAKTAAILGREEEAAHYRELHRSICITFRHEFVTPSGRVASPTQTAYALALMFDLLEEPARKRTADLLAAHIEDNGTHLTTGFVGTPYLCLVLTRFGYNELAYRLALQKEYPSWLYPVTMGATTIWEHWDGIKPNGSFWDKGMNSFNHYAYGAIGDWLYRCVAGIDTVEAAPGYKLIRIAPQIGQPLSSAQATLESLYGLIRSGWVKRAGGSKAEAETGSGTEAETGSGTGTGSKEAQGTVELSVTIPANTEAEVVLPSADLTQITESGAPLAAAPGVLAIEQEADEVRVSIGSGQYRFTFPWQESVKK